MKKWKVLSLASVLLVLVLAACSPTPAASVPEAQEATSAPEATGVPAEAPPAEPVEFTFTSWALNEGASRDVVMAYIQKYGTDNNAVITDQAFPWGETLTQLVLQGSGGTAEGAAQLDIAWLTALAATGSLKDLSAYTEGIDYTSAALSSGQNGGVQYGLPWTTGSIGLAANSGILEAAGVTELPTTIEEFETALEQIKAYDPEIIPYAAMTTPGGLKDMISWIRTFGGTVVDEDGTVTLGDESSVAALEWYKSLFDRGLIAPEMDRFTARQLFSQGKVAFYDDAIVLRGIVTKDATIENLEELIVPVPRPVLNEGDDPQAMLWGHIVVVFDGENSDAAAEWAQYLTSDVETTTDYFKNMALPPTTDTVLASEAVANDEFTANWTSGITATAKPNPFWLFPESAQMETIMDENIQAYLIGSVGSAKEALDKANQQISELMK